MKKTAFTIAAGALLLSTGCQTVDTWGDGLPEMEHVYYVGFEKTDRSSDYLYYQIAQDGASSWRYGTNKPTMAWIPAEASTATVPFQFHSERVRAYDATTKFWIVESGLKAGVDYSISLDGTALTPVEGVYSLVWPQAKKGVQSVKIKRLSTTDGSLKIYTLDPAKGTPNPNEYTVSTVNNKGAEYEVRGFSFDYDKVIVTFKK